MANPLVGNIPDNLWVKCPKCKELNYAKELEANLKVCRRCDHHFRLGARERIDMLCDSGSFHEYEEHLRTGDPLGFVNGGKSYAARLEEARSTSGLPEAVVVGAASLDGIALGLAVMDFNFLAASMGSVVGEKVTRIAERALAQRLPLVIVSASGGARMHEGLYSLMQMAKTAAAIACLREARLPYISILTDPTTGGVTASFALEADVILAEPRALIGFAGPRVIEQTTRQKLPADVDTAEFMLQHGMVDMVVQRRELRQTVATLLKLLRPLSEEDAHGV